MKKGLKVMSLEHIQSFFRFVADSPELQLQFRSMTGSGEILKLGRRNGFWFTLKELAEASSSLPNIVPIKRSRQTPTQSELEPSQPVVSRLLHYEWVMNEIPSLEKACDELENLKIKPTTIDLQAFQARTRKDDRDFADMSPASPGFRERYDEMMQSERRTPPGEARRSFHLINLDENIDHDQYESYFAAKTRLLAALEAFFGDEVRFSGSMWYPPRSYRAWHTNETQPGWRMYLIDFDAPEVEIRGKSFFRYMNSQTGELVTLDERPKIMRFFKIEQESDRLLWHCIVNDSAFSRWSFGFVVPEDWMDKLSCHQKLKPVQEMA